jgi:hypothetical protein
VNLNCTVVPSPFDAVPVFSIFVFKAQIFKLILQHKNIFVINNSGVECLDIFNHASVKCRKLNFKMPVLQRSKISALFLLV